MTKVLYECGNGFFSLTCEGHAGYSEYGKDIVCAGISALCAALENALDNLQDKALAQTHCCSMSAGRFHAEATAAPEKTEVETAFETVYGGLCRISGEYGAYLQCSRKTAEKEENR